MDFSSFNFSNSSSLKANTKEPFLLKGNSNSSAKESIILLASKFNLAFNVPFFSLYPPGIIPLFALDIPSETSWFLSITDTSKLYLDSSLAIEQPTIPAPIITTSFKTIPP